MGADGGSIPKRDDLVKTKKKEEKADQFELGRIKWTLCAMSKEPLKPPIVVDQFGLLFNKETIINNLIDKAIPKGFKHIHSLKDVFDVNFKANPRHDPHIHKMRATLALTDWAKEAPFICPITNIEVGVNHKFSVIKSCGCALSDKALRECPSEVCLVCNKPFTKNDVQPLNPDEEELKELKIQFKAQRELAKKQKREKKEAAKKAITEQAGETTVDKKKRKDKEQPEPQKKQKVSGSIDLSLQPKKEKPKAAKIPTNATPSVYASIFTSSVKEPAQKESFLCRNVTRG